MDGADSGKGSEFKGVLLNGSDVVFQKTSQNSPDAASTSLRTNAMVRVLRKYSGGLIWDERDARLALLGCLVLLGIAMFFVMRGGNAANIEAPPGQKVEYPADGPPRLAPL